MYELLETDESIALTRRENQYYETETVNKDDVISCIKSRKIFPCLFGSALKLSGVDEFLECLYSYTKIPKYGSDVAGKVYKISEEKGQRLTFL